MTGHQAANWGFNMALWLTIVPVVATEITFEMSSGFLARSLVAGLKPVDVFASTFVVYSLISLAQSFFLLLFILLVPFKGSTFAMFGRCYVFIALQGVWNVLFAILLALLIKDPSIVGMTSFGSFFSISFLIGNVRTQDAMKGLFHLQSLIWPSHFTKTVFLEIIMRSKTFFTKSVLISAAMNFLWLIFLVFLIFMLRKRIY